MSDKTSRFRGLTLHQPWASLMAWGYKTVETRPWQIGYRGPMAIHAAKAFQPYAVEVCMANLTIRRILLQKMHETGICRDQRVTRSRLEELLPLGAIVAKCRLDDIVSTSAMGTLSEPLFKRMQREIEFGNYRPKRFMWFTSDMRAFVRPIEYTGMQGLWYLDPAYDELMGE